MVIGETSHAFDGDGGNVDDVVFSTTDPLGFNTSGPGVNQQFIDESGLEAGVAPLAVQPAVHRPRGRVPFADEIEVGRA